MREMKHIYTTEPGETVVALCPYHGGIVIATTDKVLYYGPDLPDYDDVLRVIAKT